MLRQISLCGTLVAALVMSARGDDNKPELPAAAATNPGFEKMKTLVGTWVVADADGKPTDQVASVIRLTANGSAIQEVSFPDTPMEMLSVYTAEGSDIVMTHYCAIGNQPRLKADGRSAAPTLRFEFAGGANFDPKKDKHMHSANLTLIDADHLQLEGEAWDKGAPSAECCGIMKFVRKK